MMKKKTKKVLGICLVVLGIIGLFLPFLQGILLIIAGLEMLGVRFSKKKKNGKRVFSFHMEKK